MSTGVTYVKGKTVIQCDTSVLPRPRPKMSWPVPVFSGTSESLLALTLVAVAQSGRSGVRITSTPTSLPGTAAASWTLFWTAYQGDAPASPTWNSVPVQWPTVNLLLDSVMPAATMIAYLQREEAGQTYTYARVQITTPADTTLADVTAAQAAADAATTAANAATTAAAYATTSATAASNAASAAAAQATAASNAAATANSAISNIISDSVLSTGEKRALIIDYNAILATQTGIDSQATIYSVSHAAYDTTVTALTSYLSGLSPAWNDTTAGHDTPVVAATFRSMWSAVYTAQAALLAAISAAALALSNAAGGNLIPNGNSSLGAIAGTGGAYVKDTNGLAYTGYQAARYVRSNAGLSANGAITDQITCVAGQVFDLSWYAAIVVSGVMTSWGGVLCLVFYDANGNSLGGGVATAPAALHTDPHPYNWTGWGAGSFQLCSSRVAAPANSAYVIAYIQPSSSEYWFSAITLTMRVSMSVASSGTAGIVKVGTGLVVDTDGTLAVGNAPSATTATTAASVPWTGVTGRPTALSAFTNDSGFLTSAPAVSSASNFRASAPGTSAVTTMSATEVIATNSAGLAVKGMGLSLTNTLTAAGANGLDTGSPAVSTWYYMWLIYNPTSTTWATLASLSSTAPTMPSGYTFKCLQSAVYSLASCYPRAFTQVGNRITWRPTTGSNLTALPLISSGAQGTYGKAWSSMISLAAFCPQLPVVASVLLVVGALYGTNCAGEIAPNNNYSPASSTSSAAPVQAGSQASNINELTLEVYGIYVSFQSNVFVSSYGFTISV